MKQMNLGLKLSKKTRKREFLEQMEQVLPGGYWSSSSPLIAPKAGTAGHRFRWKPSCVSTSSSNG